MGLQEMELKLNDLALKFDALMKALNVPVPNSEPLVIGEVNSAIEQYRKFLLQNRKVTELTAKNRLWHLREFLNRYPAITSENVLEYFDAYQLETNRFNARFRAIIPFLRDYSKRPDLVMGLKMQNEKMKLIKVPSIEQVRTFYAALPEGEIRFLFLMLAVSGLRLGEILSLRAKDVDPVTGKLDVSWVHSGRTKSSNFSFINAETLEALSPVLAAKSQEERIFPTWLEGEHYADRFFREASAKCKIKLTPKDLRSFWASWMIDHNMPESRVDFLQGRLSKSVLRRHYLDFSEEKIFRLYQRAGLSILS